MDIFYICNEKMRRSYRLEAIFNKIRIMNNIVHLDRYISIYSNKVNRFKNNVFLLLDKIKKVVVFK